MTDRPEPEGCEGTAREHLSDDEIARGVRRAIASKLELEMHPVEVTVHDGVVTLRGSIDSATLRQEAAELAAMAPGVREIVNLIVVPGDWA